MIRAFIAACVLVLASSFAGGQEMAMDMEMGVGSYYDPWAVPATLPEVQALCEAAGLGADTQAAAKALVEGCEAALKREERRMQRAMERSWLVRKPEENEARQDDMQKASEKRT